LNSINDCNLLSVNDLYDIIPFKKRNYIMNRITDSLLPKLEPTVKKSLKNICIDETIPITDFLNYFIQTHSPEVLLNNIYRDYMRDHVDPSQFWKRDLDLRTYACVIRFFKRSFFWKRIRSDSDKISAQFRYQAATVKISLVASRPNIPLSDIRTEVELVWGPERRVFHIQPLNVRTVSPAPKHPKYYTLSIRKIYEHVIRLPFSKTSYSIKKFNRDGQVISEATWDLESRIFIFFRPGLKKRIPFEQINITKVSNVLEVDNKVLSLFNSYVDSISFRLWDIRFLPRTISRDAMYLLKSFKLTSGEKTALMDKKPFEKKLSKKSLKQFEDSQWICRRGETLSIPHFVKQLLEYEKSRYLHPSL